MNNKDFELVRFDCVFEENGLNSFNMKIKWFDNSVDEICVSCPTDDDDGLLDIVEMEIYVDDVYMFDSKVEEFFENDDEKIEEMQSKFYFMAENQLRYINKDLKERNERFDGK